MFLSWSWLMWRAAVETRDFFRPQEFSQSNEGYHFYFNAETHYLIGKAMGLEMNRLVPEQEQLQRQQAETKAKYALER